VVPGIRCEISFNVDTSDGLANGQPTSFKYYDAESEKIWVNLLDPKLRGLGNKRKGKQAALRRRLHLQLTNKGIQTDCSNWISFGREFKTSFRTITDKDPVKPKRDGPSVTRKQFPILAAAAKTGHKSQSETHQRVLANLATAKHDHGAYYTILSRVTSREGLKIFNVNWAVIDDVRRIDPAVHEEMQRLENFRIQVCQPQLNERPGIHLVYHNISTLIGQWRELIDVDQEGKVKSKYDNLLDAHVLIFSEAHLTQAKVDRISHQQNEAYQLPGFKRLPLPNHPNDSQYGIVCYYKDSAIKITDFNRLLPNHMRYAQYSGFKQTGQVEVVSFLLDIEDVKWLIIAIYKAPPVPLPVLLDQLAECLRLPQYCHQGAEIEDRILIIGDFNVRMDADEEANDTEYGKARRLQDWMERQRFAQLEIGPGGTTDQGTEIDLAWAKIPDSNATHQLPRPEVATMDSYYSYHKMLLATLPTWRQMEEDVEMKTDSD